ncbi:MULTISPECIES: sulfatase-like hydrolase/transferase [Flavobacteriaceae]|uniref:sulfatase-like hydrolase/transferase n=1 Tax=Flavobacteriaceae TaxID=49546 RepID=UPI001491253E|nr:MULTISPECIES: sulfatase-like hydrolase/transferase [Allomuricauda]MDC6366235.1 sulfatase-like hydrolase/transferase [Muricauda sp. AC10]
MKNKILFLISVIFLTSFVKAQQTNDTKVVLITLDGLRWQELFTGADSDLIENKEYVQSPESLKKYYWKDTPEARREALMPFFWTEVAKIGQLHGNRVLGSKMNLTNGMWFSYPGYNEILTGKADDKNIKSNDKIPNPNTTILELANKDDRYKGKVAAFGSWDVFPYIINEERSGVPVNAGYEKAVGDNLTEREKMLNDIQRQAPIIWESVRLDVFTHNYALEEMKKNHPQLLYVSYGETDDFAHGGFYDFYLQSAQRTDAMIKQLWDFTQQDPFYKDQTIFLITTDHGRGTQPLKTWKDHGSNIKGADQVWLVAFGKGISPKGEVGNEEQLYSNQLAPTILKLLGMPITENMEGTPLKL